MEVLSLIVLLLAVLYNARIVVAAAADVPRADEWNNLVPDGLGPAFNWDWIIASNGSHRIVFTRLQTWLHYHLDGWNIANQEIGNYLLFLSILVLLLWIKRETTTRGTFTLFPLLLIFLLSPIAYENHTWGYQSQFHFLLLFGLLAPYFAFRRFHSGQVSLRDSLLFGLFTLSAMYSFSSGITMGIVYLAFFALRGVIAFAISEAPRLRVLTAMVLGLLPPGLGLFFWFGEYGGGGEALPTTMVFWNFFLNLVSLGYGVETSLSLVPGLAVLGTLAVMLLVLALRPSDRLAGRTWIWGVYTLGIFAALAAIAMGRAPNYAGEFHQAKFSRYAEIAFFLIPSMAMLGWYCLEGRRWLQRAAVIAYLGICAIGFRNNWDFSIYPNMHSGRLADFECIEQYFAGQNDGFCQRIHHLVSMKDKFDYAASIGVSFAKRAQHPS